jgi:hypothetical protein
LQSIVEPPLNLTGSIIPTFTHLHSPSLDCTLSKVTLGLRYTHRIRGPQPITSPPVLLRSPCFTCLFSNCSQTDLGLGQIALQLHFECSFPCPTLLSISSITFRQFQRPSLSGRERSQVTFSPSLPSPSLHCPHPIRPCQQEREREREICVSQTNKLCNFMYQIVIGLHAFFTFLAFFAHLHQFVAFRHRSESLEDRK